MQDYCQDTSPPALVEQAAADPITALSLAALVRAVRVLRDKAENLRRSADEEARAYVEASEVLGRATAAGDWQHASARRADLVERELRMRAARATARAFETTANELLQGDDCPLSESVEDATNEAREAREPKPRDRATGRYEHHLKWERVCMCGHPLASHSADTHEGKRDCFDCEADGRDDSQHRFRARKEGRESAKGER